MERELLVQCPDGQVKTVPLAGERMAVGRSSSAELSFPEDAGLSRQHFAFESDEGDSWAIRDLGSKNGTYVNNIPLKARLLLKPGDRITAGRLAIIYSPPSRRDATPVFFDNGRESPSTHTLVTSLEGALSSQTMGIERSGRRAAPMQALIRAGQELAQYRPLHELFQIILDLAVEAVNAQRGVLLVLEGDVLVPKAHRGDGFRISTAVRDRVLLEGASVLVRDAQLDDAFKGRVSIVEQRVHTMMAAPLQTKDRIIGLIYLDSPLVIREFTKDDLSLLTVMANVAAIRLENVRLTEIEQADRILKRDLDQAAEIQRRILPQGAPEVPGADLAGYNVVCRGVGGDYYGYFPYPDGRVGLGVGDVSGKGMPASLMVMGLQARLEALAGEDPKNPGTMMTRLNRITCSNCPPNRFITFFFSVLNPATGELMFANAGHNPPIIMRASGELDMIEGGGPVLGILPIATYRQDCAKLEKGDILVLYSDGVTEAFDVNDEEYGVERLAEVLREHRTESAGSIVDAVMQSVAEFSTGTPQADDITLLVARRV
jgi:serine phosphatase RsbU (regulator of sigma subunit)